MRTRALLLGLSLLSLPGIASARLYDRPINIITSDYDLVDTTYIDRGRLDGIRVGDKLQVKFPDGKLVTEVVVTGVFERMASVKIADSWLLKNGQLAGYDQRPMVVALEPIARRRAPKFLDAHVHTAPMLAANTGPNNHPAAPDSGLPTVPSATPSMADSGLPSPPGAPALSASVSVSGLPATPDAGLPGPPGAPAASMKASASVSGSADLPATPDAGLPAPPGAPAANGGPSIPPPPE